MKLRIVLLLIVIALIAGVFYRTHEKPAGPETRKGGGAVGGILTVRTVPVALRDLPRVLDLPGMIDAAKQVAIVAQTSGVLQQQRVQEGQTVRAGELLFTLDARPLGAQIDQHRATLAGAQAAERQAARLVTQLAPLNAPGYISRKEFADAQLAQEAARANARNWNGTTRNCTPLSPDASAGLMCSQGVWCKPMPRHHLPPSSPRARWMCAPMWRSRTGRNSPKHARAEKFLRKFMSKAIRR